MSVCLTCGQTRTKEATTCRALATSGRLTSIPGTRAAAHLLLRRSGRAAGVSDRARTATVAKAQAGAAPKEVGAAAAVGGGIKSVVQHATRWQARQEVRAATAPVCASRDSVPAAAQLPAGGGGDVHDSSRHFQRSAPPRVSGRSAGARRLQAQRNCFPGASPRLLTWRGRPNFAPAALGSPGADVNRLACDPARSWQGRGSGSGAEPRAWAGQLLCAAMRRARGRPPHARPWFQACAMAFILACLPAASFGAPLRVRPEKVHKDSVLDAAPHQFGFVCGVHFSGTSILHYALGLHPEVSIMHTAAVRMDEGQGFQDVMPTADTLGEAYLAKLHEATHPLTKESPGSKPPRTREVGRYFALDYSGRLDASAAAGNATRLRQQWQVLWDTNKRVLVEKSPPDLIRMRFLAAVFPPTWFVVIVRHPLAVCRRVEWRMRLLCAHNWLNAYEWGLQDIQEGQLRAHVTYYEDWARQPVKELQAMAGVTTLDRCAASPVRLLRRLTLNVVCWCPRPGRISTGPLSSERGRT